MKTITTKGILGEFLEGHAGRMPADRETPGYLFPDNRALIRLGVFTYFAPTKSTAVPGLTTVKAAGD